jgi:hypothetical protein
MMIANNVLSILILATICGYLLARRLRKTKRFFVPDYKRGVRFVKGAFASVLGPGSYVAVTLKEQIEVVDMRPQPILLERISYRDAWQNESFVSVAAEMHVCDAHLATTMLKNQINDSVPIVRDTLRSVVSRGIADRSPEFLSKTAADIAKAANVELIRVGMRISNVEIIESWSRPSSGHTTAISH